MGLDVPVKAEMYFPYQQITDQPWFIPRDLAIRTVGDTSALVNSVRQAIREVDPDHQSQTLRPCQSCLVRKGRNGSWA
jgi:hypothetical protein